MQCLREMQSLVNQSPQARCALTNTELAVLSGCADLMHTRLKRECLGGRFKKRIKKTDPPHAFIESDPGRLSTFCDQMELEYYRDELVQQQTPLPPPPSPPLLLQPNANSAEKESLPNYDKKEEVIAQSWKKKTSARLVLARIRSLITRIQAERARRWVAVGISPVPKIHYVSLGLLASPITMAILVSIGATTTMVEKNDGLSQLIRILWTFFCACMTSIVVTLLSLANMFAETSTITNIEP